MIRASFFMEQHVGHRTFYRNLRDCIDLDPRIAANWVEITYQDPDSNWGKILYLPENLKGSFIGRQQVRQGWSEHDFDIAFYSTQVTAALGGSVVKRTPYVLCTDITPIQYDAMAEYYGHKPDRSGLLSAYKQRRNVSIFNDAAHIVPWTNWVSQSLVDDYGVSPSRITVVPVGVDLKLWKSRAIQTDGPVRFLFVGGDFHRKGGDLLLEAFQQLPKGAAELILVTRESVPEQENVKVYNNLQPNSPELVMLFQESDVFVLPTRAEAYGIVAIEAGASGMPVIMTDIGGVRDIVLDNKNGYLIDVDDVPQLVDRMSRMINDPDLRRQMGRNARERVEKYFDAHKNAARVVDILLGVVAKQVVR
jgi:glycosyltransferase involved in cell wall biosynthesis